MRATCARCQRSISIYSDEYEEWTEIDDGYADGRPPEGAFSIDRLYLVCRDCLSPEEAEGFEESQKLLIELKRRLPRKRSS